MENREIDRLIVKHVLQIPLAQESESFIDGWLDGQNFYSTYMGDAWKIVEHLNPRKTKFILNYLQEGNPKGEGWHCCVDDVHVFNCESAPMAICKTALLSVGIEIE